MIYVYGNPKILFATRHCRRIVGALERHLRIIILTATFLLLATLHLYTIVIQIYNKPQKNVV